MSSLVFWNEVLKTKERFDPGVVVEDRENLRRKVKEKEEGDCKKWRWNRESTENKRSLHLIK